MKCFVPTYFAGTWVGFSLVKTMLLVVGRKASQIYSKLFLLLDALLR